MDSLRVLFLPQILFMWSIYYLDEEGKGKEEGDWIERGVRKRLNFKIDYAQLISINGSEKERREKQKERERKNILQDLYGKLSVALCSRLPMPLSRQSMLGLSPSCNSHDDGLAGIVTLP